MSKSPPSPKPNVRGDDTDCEHLSVLFVQAACERCHKRFELCDGRGVSFEASRCCECGRIYLGDNHVCLSDHQHAVWCRYNVIVDQRGPPIRPLSPVSDIRRRTFFAVGSSVDSVGDPATTSALPEYNSVRVEVEDKPTLVTIPEDYKFLDDDPPKPSRGRGDLWRELLEKRSSSPQRPGGVTLLVSSRPASLSPPFTFGRGSNLQYRDDSRPSSCP
jgi:hypothetical protein